MGELDSNSAGMSVGELEGAVLRALWDFGEQATPAVYERVGRPRGLAYTTILTVLQRLLRKRLVLRRPQGKGHVYRAAFSRESYAERQAQSLASQVVALGSAGITAFLAEATRLEPRLVEEARRALENRE